MTRNQQTPPPGRQIELFADPPQRRRRREPDWLYPLVQQLRRRGSSVRQAGQHSSTAAGARSRCS